VQPQRVCRNRLLSLQSFFRRSSRYAFWQLDMMIKRHLFFFNLHRVRSNWKSTAAPDDKFAQAFGTIIPRHIPESSAWWKVVLVCLFLQTLVVCLSSKSLSGWWLQRALVSAARRSRAGSWRRFATMPSQACHTVRAYATSRSLCAHLQRLLEYVRVKRHPPVILIIISVPCSVCSLFTPIDWTVVCRVRVSAARMQALCRRW
jgi:hypothetical protein